MDGWSGLRVWALLAQKCVEIQLHMVPLSTWAVPVVDACEAPVSAAVVVNGVHWMSVAVLAWTFAAMVSLLCGDIDCKGVFVCTLMDEVNGALFTIS